MSEGTTELPKAPPPASPDLQKGKEAPTKAGFVARVDEGLLITEYPKVDERSLEDILREEAKNNLTVSVRPVKITEVTTNIQGRKGTKLVVTEDDAGQVYIEGQVFTRDQIGRMDDREMIRLLQNMGINKWDRVVKTRTGKFQPFGERDSVITSEELKSPLNK